MTKDQMQSLVHTTYTRLQCLGLDTAEVIFVGMCLAAQAQLATPGIDEEHDGALVELVGEVLPEMLRTNRAQARARAAAQLNLRFAASPARGSA